MRTYFRSLLSCVGVLAIGSFFVLASVPLTYRIASAQDDPQRHLYENPALFEQLSGAARTLLERRYGNRDKYKEKESEAKEGAHQIEAGEAPPFLNPLEAPLLTDLSGLEEPASAPVNTLVNNPAADATAQDTQSETTIVLGSGSTVIVGFNDSGSAIGGANKVTGFSRSTDGGASFTDMGTLPTNASGDAGDPVLARDNVSGTIYFSTLARIGSAMQVFRSFDNGASFTAPVNGAPGFGGGDFLDKEWITVDNFSGPGQGNVYLVFRNFAGGGAGSQPGGIYFTRSTDGGATFGPSPGTLIFAGGQGAFVTVGPDHAVYVFWWSGSIFVRKSTDQGLSFGPTVTVATLLSTGVNGDLGLEFRTNSFPHAAVNPVNGQVYVVFNDNPAGLDRGDVFATSSTDGGATWDPPLKINDDATTRDQWQPTGAVTPDGSRVFVGWYDRRLDPGNSLIDTWGVTGSVNLVTGDVTFGPNFRLTTQSFPAVFGQDPVVNPTYMGDYDQAVADNSFFYYTWADNRGSNSFHTNQPDIRFAKIPVAGPGPVLSITSAATSGGNLNGVIDVNECNNLNVTLRNLGTSAATGIFATLAFNSSGLTIAQSSSAYPNIAVGGTGTNTTPFQISTSPGFTCGSNLDLKLTVTTASGDVSVLPFRLNSGSLAAPTRFDNNTPTAIPDEATVDSLITVSGITSAIAKVTVSFHITHTFDSDLDVSLIGPDGTTVGLTSDNGPFGLNYGNACVLDSSRTTFDDAAGTAITSGSPPFVGTFRPEQALSAFIGKSGSAVNGTWTLRITDDEAVDVGILQCWSLFISGLTCADGGGVCPLPPPSAPKLSNISTRGPVQTGDNVMIGGFIIGGTSPKTVLIRGRGPSLGGAPFNIPGVLADPLLQLFSGPTLVAQNNDWQVADPLCGNSGFACGVATEVTATGLDPCIPNPGQATPPPGCAQESAILISLPPGGYTAIQSGVGGGTGVGLVEVFEVDGATNPSKLTNISTRGRVETGDNVMIGGVIIVGPTSKRVLIRGRGPSMGGAPFNIPGVLPDPLLQLFSGPTLIGQNNNWQDPVVCDPGFVCEGAAQITATGLDPCIPNPGQATPPPGCGLESAILITLPPGAYTAIESGVGGGAGVGLVEVFELN